MNVLSFLWVPKASAANVQPVAIAPINTLPNDVVLEIFSYCYTVNHGKNLSLVCKKWNRLSHDMVICRLLMHKYFSHMVSKRQRTNQYFVEAFHLASNTKQLAVRFVGKERNLMNYAHYKSELNKAFTISKESLEAIPFFDLSCFGWLYKDDWMKLFCQVLPHLENVAVINANGVGKEIAYRLLGLPEVPVIKTAAAISKFSLDIAETILGYDHRAVAIEDTASRLMFCIYAIAKKSGKVTTLNIKNTSLTIHHVKRILQGIQTLQEVNVDSSVSWRLRDEFKDIAFRNG